MSWIQKLHETYDLCATAPQFKKKPPLPMSHSRQQAHIEIVLDAAGRFLRAKVVAKEETVIPITEESAGRVGTKPPPHPLSDKVQYCAADYSAFGGAKESFYPEYIEQLRRWDESDQNHKVHAVLSYVERGTVVADLVRERILWCSEDHKLLTEWTENSAIPELFKMLTPKDGKREQGDAFIRWRVEVPDDLESATWEDPAVRESWIRFDASQHSDIGLCMVTGEDTALATSHPKRLRHGADGAKLISSNDSAGFTFRGRFTSPEQACGVGTIVTQKAHNTLRWLIDRQAYHDKASGQVFVAWAVGGQDIPDPFKNTEDLLLTVPVVDAIDRRTYSGDAGQQFAVRLKKMITGYRAEMGDSADVVMMGLDSATPGRMAITFYRELEGSEFLDRILAWHAENSWHQNYAKDFQFIGAPAPIDIALAAYGRRVDDRLRKATVERLLPCIVDGRPLPRDIVELCVRRVCNRVGFKKERTRESEWEKCLGIACALFRGSRKEGNYLMSLEEDRTTRDYLFGRLLAIADYTEQQALYVADEKRDSNAAKLMQRFAGHPCSTWRNIELALAPYKSRLRANRPGQLVKLEKLLDSVVGMFQGHDFTNDAKLSGEFLLGYHCQRAALWTKQGANPEPRIKCEEAIQGEES
jgi:CRISPR-associated protein Csd1